MLTYLVTKYFRRLLGGYVFQKLVDFFLSKKKIIQIVGSIALALGAMAAGMQTVEFKELICSSTVIQLPPLGPVAPAPTIVPVIK